MQYELISHTDSARLIIFFAGWAMDARPFASLKRDGYDIAVVYDYRCADIDFSFADRYKEICIVAWSLGVQGADMCKEQFGCKVTLRLAICGTGMPCHDTMGIPSVIYNGTINMLDPRNLNKFYRRVCGTKETFEEFMKHCPQRDINELRAELEAVASRNVKPGRWDMALIAADDAIIPPHNQRRYWNSIGVPCDEIAGGHMPDFQQIINRHIINKDLTQRRFSSRQASYDIQAHIQDVAASSLFELCRPVLSECKNVLEIGCGTGKLSRRLLEALPAECSLYLWDIVDCNPVEGSRAFFESVEAECGINSLDRHSLDLIISSSAIQWFNSPGAFLGNCLRPLKQGGYIAVSTFAAGTLQEVAEASGAGLPLLSEEQWHSIIAPGYDIAHFEVRTEELIFDTALDVFRHLKETGVNSLEGNRSMRHALATYSADSDGRYHLTYKPLIFILRKR